MPVALSLATVEQGRLSLGAAGAHAAGLVVAVTLWLAMTGQGRKAAVRGLHAGPSLEEGLVFPVKLGEAAHPDPVGTVPTRGLRSRALLGKKRVALFLPASLSPLWGGQEQRLGCAQLRGLPLRQLARSLARPPARLCTGHGDTAHQLQGSHNSFKTITLFI